MADEPPSPTPSEQVRELFPSTASVVPGQETTNTFPPTSRGSALDNDVSYAADPLMAHGGRDTAATWAAQNAGLLKSMLASGTGKWDQAEAALLGLDEDDEDEEEDEEDEDEDDEDEDEEVGDAQSSRPAMPIIEAGLVSSLESSSLAFDPILNFSQPAARQRPAVVSPSESSSSSTSSTSSAAAWESTPLTAGELAQLKERILELPARDLQRVVDIVMDGAGSGDPGRDSEVEVDLSQLDASAQRRLLAFCNSSNDDGD